jgi:hypothetical protein
MDPYRGGSSLVETHNNPTDTKLFYDPCKESLCSGDHPVIALSDLTVHVPFHVGSTGSDEALGTWPIVFMSNNESANAGNSERAAMLQEWRLSGTDRNVPWRLRREFIEQVVSGGGIKTPGGVGNTPAGKHWGTSEGFGNESMQFCDAIADWWPEDWSKPVGYHVTLPCDGADSAYRTFDSAFAMETSTDGPFTVTMRYVNTMLRNITAASNEYGRSGFCRRGVYGMPTHVTNTMRVCTRDSADVRYDATVPILPIGGGPSESEYCSDSPYDVPWSVDEGLGAVHPNMHSVGHQGFYRGQSEFASGTVYPPESLVNERGAVHPGLRDLSWGASCTDGEFLYCTTDDDCMGISGETLKCFRGVCIVRRPANSFTCYQHSDCQPYDQMCSGEGICEDAVWQVENALAEDVEFDLFSEECTAGGGAMDVESYDMWGGSKWESIPDILEMYGMCSYRNWYEYRQFIDPTQGLTPHRSDAGECAADLECKPGSFDTHTKILWDTDADKTQPLRTLAATPDRFRVQSHACDKDYMYVRDMHGCAPVEAMLLETGSGIDPGTIVDKRRSRYAQTIERDRYIDIPKSEYFDDATFGFLIAGADIHQYPMNEGSNPTDFQMCNTVDQCLKYPFFYNGVNTNREVYDSNFGNMRPWEHSDTITCGSFGVLLGTTTACGETIDDQNPHCCQLDRAVLVQHYFLCTGIRKILDAAVEGRGTIEDAIAICNGLPDFYSMSSNSDTRYMQIDVKMRKLNSLWDLLSSKTVTTDPAGSQMSKYVMKTSLSDEFASLMQSHTQCATSPHFCASYHLVEGAKKSGVYYLGQSGLYEFPLAWWHKCMVLESSSFQVKLSGGVQIQCPSWDDKLDLSTDGYTGEGLGFLKRLNAGITNKMMESAMFVFKNDVNTAMEGFAAGAKMAPTCATKIKYTHSTDMADECIVPILDYSWGGYSPGGRQLFEAIGAGCYNYDDDESTYLEMENPVDIRNEVKNAIARFLKFDVREYDSITNTARNNNSGFLVGEYVPSAPALPYLTQLNHNDGPRAWGWDGYDADVCISTAKARSIKPKYLDCAKGGCTTCLVREFCDLTKDALLSIVSESEKRDRGLTQYGRSSDKASLRNLDGVFDEFAFDLSVNARVKIEVDYIACMKNENSPTWYCDPSAWNSPCALSKPDKAALTKTLMNGKRFATADSPFGSDTYALVSSVVHLVRQTAHGTVRNNDGRNIFGTAATYANEVLWCPRVDNHVGIYCARRGQQIRAELGLFGNLAVGYDVYDKASEGHVIEAQDEYIFATSEVDINENFGYSTLMTSNWGRAPYVTESTETASTGDVAFNRYLNQLAGVSEKVTPADLEPQPP